MLHRPIETAVHFCAIILSFNNKVIYDINIDLFKWLLCCRCYMLISGRPVATEAGRKTISTL